MSRLLIHFVCAAVACAQLAYWTIQLMTPPPAAAPALVPAFRPPDPDPVLLARALGQVEPVAPAAIANIQLGGVLAAGGDSAAVLVVGNGPAKAVRLGQEVAPGSVLIEVNPQTVTLESGGVRRQLRVPNPPLASSSGPMAAQGARFEQRGNVLTAPSVDIASAPRPASRRSRTAIAPPQPEATPAAPGRRDMGGMPTRQ